MTVWKETYGFDFVSVVPGQGDLSNPTDCYLDCLKAEYSQFAKNCRKGGGVFKCCHLGYTYLSLMLLRLSIVKPVLHNTLLVSNIKYPGCHGDLQSPTDEYRLIPFQA